MKKNNFLLTAIVGTFALISSTKAEEKPSISGNVSATFASDYVARPGFVVGKGPVNQSSAGIDIDKLTVFTWQNYDFGAGRVTERDTGFTYHFPSLKLSDFAFTPRLGYQAWQFPGSLDHVLEGGIHHEGKIHLDATLTYLLPGSDAKEGVMFHATVSKPLTLAKGSDYSFTFTPQVRAAALSDFYGANGFSKVTPGLELALNRGKFSLNFSAHYQFGTIKEMKSLPYFGGGISYKF